MSSEMRSVRYYSFLVFFAALHAFLPIYINSSVVLQTTGNANAFTLTFALGALCSLTTFYLAPRILSAIGNRWFLIIACGLEGLALLTLSSAPTYMWVQAEVVLYTSMAPLIGYSLDVFFENSFLNETKTGIARGLFLTSGNTALVLSPIISGFLAGISFSYVYILASIVLALFLVIALPAIQNFKDPIYIPATFKDFFNACKGDHRAITLAQLVLRIFFGFAAVFMPLLLLSRDFTWPQIGTILGIALLPFMLFAFPVGRLSDRIGEKLLLILGFCILGAATYALSFDLPASLSLYTFIFFCTRAGAAIVEVTTESNFFRTVGASDSSAIMLFRMTAPIGALIAVSLGGLALLFISLPALFALVSLLAFFGMIPALYVPKFQKTI